MPGPSKCPICKREIPASEGMPAFGPFCSARCRSIDLGNWLEGQYRIGTTMDEVEDELSPAIDPKDASH